MEMCIPHMQCVMERLKLLNIDHLVAKDHKDLQERMLRGAQGKSKIDDYCPLYACQANLFMRALSCLGAYVGYAKEDGTHYCPLCEVKANYDKHKNGTCTDPHCTIVIGADEQSWEIPWLIGCTDAALRDCRELKLVAPLQ